MINLASQSVRDVHYELHSFLIMSLMDANRRKASPFRFRHSQSFASLRHRPSKLGQYAPHGESALAASLSAATSTVPLLSGARTTVTVQGASATTCEAVLPSRRRRVDVVRAPIST